MTGGMACLGKSHLLPWYTFPDHFLPQEGPPASQSFSAAQWPLIPSISMKSCLTGSQHHWCFLSLMPLSHLLCSTVISWHWLPGSQPVPTFGLSISLWAQVALVPHHSRMSELQSQCPWYSHGVPNPQACSKPLGSWGTTCACHVPQDLLLGHGGQEGGFLYPWVSLRRVNLPASSSFHEERPTGHLLLLRDG